MSYYKVSKACAIDISGYPSRIETITTLCDDVELMLLLSVKNNPHKTLFKFALPLLSSNNVHNLFASPLSQIQLGSACDKILIVLLLGLLPL